MSDDGAVAQYYTRGTLLESIQAAIERLGKTIDDVTIDDFAPVDEFHVGGRQATEQLVA